MASRTETSVVYYYHRLLQDSVPINQAQEPWNRILWNRNRPSLPEKQNFLMSATSKMKLSDSFIYFSFFLKGILSSLSKVFYPASIRVSAMSTGTNALPQYETLSLSSPQEYVVQVELNRPEKRNAMNKTFFR